MPGTPLSAPAARRLRVIQKREFSKHDDVDKKTHFLYLFALTLKNSMKAASSVAPCSGDRNHSETMDASCELLCVCVWKKKKGHCYRHLGVSFRRQIGRVSLLVPPPLFSFSLSAWKRTTTNPTGSPHLVVVRRRVAQRDREQPRGAEAPAVSVIVVAVAAAAASLHARRCSAASKSGTDGCCSTAMASSSRPWSKLSLEDKREKRKS